MNAPGRSPVDASQWSRSSKQSSAFRAPPITYEDIQYHCWRCGNTAVFPAAEQKKAFEVRKASIWQRRVLCPECWEQRLKLERDIRDCQTRWRTQKRELQRDRQFLGMWLELLETYPKFAGRANHASIRMLQRLLGELA
jgi:hypothetical protein